MRENVSMMWNVEHSSFSLPLTARTTLLWTGYIRYGSKRGDAKPYIRRRHNRLWIVIGLLIVRSYDSVKYRLLVKLIKLVRYTIGSFQRCALLVMHKWQLSIMMWFWLVICGFSWLFVVIGGFSWLLVVMHLSIRTPTPPLPGLRGATVGHLPQFWQCSGPQGWGLGAAAWWAWGWVWACGGTAAIGWRPIITSMDCSSHYLGILPIF